MGSHLSRSLARITPLVAGLVLLLGGSTASASSAGAQHGLNVGSAHIFWQRSQSTPQSYANNLIYHGGLVETKPAVYFVFWGPKWQNGFSFSAGGHTYTNQTVQTYLKGFFGNVGGSPWEGVQTQYCQYAAIGAVGCNGYLSAQHIQNLSGQLKGSWTDPSPVPNPIVTSALAVNSVNDPVAQEATKAAKHFGYNINATYFIFTEPGIVATAYGTVYCAYHSETAHQLGSHGVRYAFMPYVPEQGAGCGQNAVNKTDDAYGHGYLDGYSIVAGHEYAEAETDPDNYNGTQDGWNDIQTSENGDKCAWTNLNNITLGSTYYAVQPLWSNAANGGQGACAFKL